MQRNTKKILDVWKSQKFKSFIFLTYSSHSWSPGMLGKPAESRFWKIHANIWLMEDFNEENQIYLTKTVNKNRICLLKNHIDMTQK